MAKKTEITIGSSFEAQYPYIAQFLEADGHIDIGYTQEIDAFVLAYDEGGTVYEGKSSYPSLDAALMDLDRGIKVYNDEWGIF